jgi:hypothetical protein
VYWTAKDKKKYPAQEKELWNFVAHFTYSLSYKFSFAAVFYSNVGALIIKLQYYSANC